MKRFLLYTLLFLTANSFAQPGTLDASFGIGGKVIYPLSTTRDDLANGMALQRDGKILVTGYRNMGTYEKPAIVRFNTNGTLDTSFAHYMYDMTLPMSSVWGSELPIAVDTSLPIDKIVLGGTLLDTVSWGESIGLFRYNLSGQSDSAFGTNGIKIIGSHWMQSFRDVIVLPDGRIVGAMNLNGQPILVRCNYDGSFDSTFGGTGRQTFSIDSCGDSYIETITLQPDGKILVLSNLTCAGNSTYQLSLVRFNNDGSKDSTFGINGASTYGYSCYNDPPQATCMAIQADGKIIVGGESNCFSHYIYNFILLRFNADGSIDSSFGGTGEVLTRQMPSYSYSHGKESVAVQQDGKIIAVSPTDDPDPFIVVARYNTNGILDSSFSINGATNDPFNNPLDGINSRSGASVIQPDGSIIVAGNISPAGGGDLDLAVFRYIGGERDTNCTPFFQIFPDSTNQGIYYGYNLSTGTNSLSYLWHFGDGDSSTLQYPSHTYAAPGQYYVCLTVSDTFGCRNTYCDSSFLVFKTEGGLMSQLNILDPNASVGINDVKNDLKITAYPNPATNQLTINLSGLQAEQVSIYNVDGKLVSEAKQPANNSIDISNLAKGVYVAEVKVRDGVQRVRWVKM